MIDVRDTEMSRVLLGTEEQERENSIDFSKTVKKLAHGLLNIYQPPLKEVKRELSELTSKQETLLARMLLENKKLNETFEDIDLNDMFATIKLYQGKLASIRKEIINIHERTFKLKKRALRLQQIRQKEALNRE